MSLTDQKLIEVSQIVAAIGALDDTAAAGVVTDLDTAMAYLKQLVTADILSTALIGAIDDAAAAGAVTDADTLTAYIKQLVTAELAALALRGTLTDVAADTTDTATMMALLRQIAEATNNGTGSAIGANLSVVDLFGSILDTAGRSVKVTAAFDGGSGSGAQGTFALFTVTGGVEVTIKAICTETVVGAGTIEAGIAGATAQFIAQVADATDLAAGEVWHDATPDAAVELASVFAPQILGDGQDIFLTIGTADLTDGTIKFECIYKPITDDGAVTAA